MKSYYIDEISTADLGQITGYLNKNAGESGMEKLFWVEIPEELLTGFQSEHTECRPHRFAIETGDTWIKAEFFIRTSVRFRCDCNGYCDENQKIFIMNYIDNLLKELGIRT